MADRVTIANSVVSRDASSIHSKIDSKERIWLVLSSAICDGSADKAINGALSKRAGKGLDLVDRVRVLPQSTSAHGPKVVENTVFIEVILKGELGWGLLGCLHSGRLVGALRRSSVSIDRCGESLRVGHGSERVDGASHGLVE